MVCGVGELGQTAKAPERDGVWCGWESRGMHTNRLPGTGTPGTRWAAGGPADHLIGLKKGPSGLLISILFLSASQKFR